jgi:hypothetical protein
MRIVICVNLVQNFVDHYVQIKPAGMTDRAKVIGPFLCNDRETVPRVMQFSVQGIDKTFTDLKR